MAILDQFKDVQMMTSLVVAVVAVTGLVMVYSDGSSMTTGAYESSNPLVWDVSLELGQLCGQCALAASNKQALPEGCYKTTSEGIFYKTDEQRGTYHCCTRACQSKEFAKATGVTGFERCAQTCWKAADDVFTGRQRFSGNPFNVPRSS